MKYAGLEVEAVKKEKARQKEFESTLAETVESFERQSKAFIDGLEDKALKNKLDKERAARKAELNRSVMAKMTGTQASSPAMIAKREGDGSASLEADAGGTPAFQSFLVGSRVITSFGTTGTIEKLDGETAEVLVGSMRLREKLENLRVIEAETRPAVPANKQSISKPIDSPDVAAELNLIGQTTAEAEYELDRFIDEAYMASLPHVRIIHGFGTGALKNYVHHFLRNHDLVERFTFAPDNQGGNGATIAELKI
jgi:DNA mismatch repair protein MutS2